MRAHGGYGVSGTQCCMQAPCSAEHDWVNKSWFEPVSLGFIFRLGIGFHNYWQ